MFDVKRNYNKVVTNAFAIGDQITLADGFTATCQKITHGGTIALFLLDQYLDEAKTHEDAQAYMNKIFTESSIFYSVKEKICRESCPYKKIYDFTGSNNEKSLHASPNSRGSSSTQPAITAAIDMHK